MRPSSSPPAWGPVAAPDAVAVRVFPRMRNPTDGPRVMSDFRQTESRAPTVTVVMAVFNAMPYLPAAVESVLNQKGLDLRLVAVDDGSTDGSRTFLEGLEDPRIKVLHQAHTGQGAARSKAFEHCRTRYVAVMDADDVSLPGRFAAQLRFLETHPQVGLLGTQFRYIGREGGRSFHSHVPTEHEDILAALLQGRHGIVNGSIMCRTDLLARTGGYRVSGSGEVWDLFLRISEVSRLANLPEVFLLYRVHPTSVNVRQMAETRLQCAYAIDCAQRRRQGLQESDFGEFLTHRRQRSWPQRALEAMDTVALKHYRRALPDLLNGSVVRGAVRLGVAALCSPRWTAQFLRRRLRNPIPSR